MHWERSGMNMQRDRYGYAVRRGWICNGTKMYIQRERDDYTMRGGQVRKGGGWMCNGRGMAIQWEKDGYVKGEIDI